MQLVGPPLQIFIAVYGTIFWLLFIGFGEVARRKLRIASDASWSLRYLVALSLGSMAAGLLANAFVLSGSKNFILILSVALISGVVGLTLHFVRRWSWSRVAVGISLSGAKRSIESVWTRVLLFGIAFALGLLVWWYFPTMNDSMQLIMSQESLLGLQGVRQNYEPSWGIQGLILAHGAPLPEVPLMASAGIAKVGLFLTILLVLAAAVQEIVSTRGRRILAFVIALSVFFVTSYFQLSSLQGKDSQFGVAMYGGALVALLAWARNSSRSNLEALAVVLTAVPLLGLIGAPYALVALAAAVILYGLRMARPLLVASFGLIAGTAAAYMLPRIYGPIPLFLSVLFPLGAIGISLALLRVDRFRFSSERQINLSAFIRLLGLFAIGLGLAVTAMPFRAVTDVIGVEPNQVEIARYPTDGETPFWNLLTYGHTQQTAPLIVLLVILGLTVLLSFRSRVGSQAALLLAVAVATFGVCLPVARWLPEQYLRGISRWDLVKDIPQWLYGIWLPIGSVIVFQVVALVLSHFLLLRSSDKTVVQLHSRIHVSRSLVVLVLISGSIIALLVRDSAFSDKWLFQKVSATLRDFREEPSLASVRTGGASWIGVVGHQDVQFAELSNHLWSLPETGPLVFSAGALPEGFPIWDFAMMGIPTRQLADSNSSSEFSEQLNDIHDGLNDLFLVWSGAPPYTPDWSSSKIFRSETPILVTLYRVTPSDFAGPAPR